MMRCQHNQKSGVILHTGAIGDCVLTLPFAASIKKTYGLDRLDFIGNTEHIGFYPDRTCIDGIISAESIPLHRLFGDSSDFFLDDKDRLSDAFSEYEQVVSFLGFGHPHFEANLLFAVHCTHSADVAVLPAKVPGNYSKRITDFYLHCFQQENQFQELAVPDTPAITPLPSDYSAGMEIVEKAGLNPDAPIVVIHPGSGSPAKCWHTENFLQVATVLKKEGIQILFLLGPAEIERFSKESIARIRSQETTLENVPLTQVLQVLTQADVFLGNDSGIGHLSAAMGKRTVVLFGPSNDIHYRPLGPNVSVLRPSAGSFSASDQTEQQNIFKAVLEML
ncbi:MAG: glycosyltransferase family 9 protein [Phycisphaerae bacterium]|nr:glycosyltransferase family 9 protein [Phycisphaerae bacterium]